jgi:hypothetical protein
VEHNDGVDRKGIEDTAWLDKLRTSTGQQCA